MKRALISIDPGITTGFAVLDADTNETERGALLATSVWGTEDLKHSLDTLIRAMHMSGYTLLAAVEKMPSVGGMSPVAQKLEKVRAQIMEVLVETYEIPVTLVAPGQWKPSRAAQVATVPRSWGGHSLMTHQRDAIRMGHYFLESYK